VIVVTNNIEFLVPVKETMRNIHERLNNVCEYAAVDKRTVGLWAGRVRDGELGKGQLLDVLHQLET
jgi:hypothetical protein